MVWGTPGRPLRTGGDRSSEPRFQRNPLAAPRRRAFTVFEMTIAVILLAAVMGVTVQTLGWVARERRASEAREVAVREVANLMERLAARPWDRLSPDSVKGVTLSETGRRALPGAELAVAVDDKGASDGAKRVALTLRWRDRAGEWVAPVRLTTWVQRAGSDKR